MVDDPMSDDKLSSPDYIMDLLLSSASSSFNMRWQEATSHNQNIAAQATARALWDATLHTTCTFPH